MLTSFPQILIHWNNKSIQEFILTALYVHVYFPCLFITIHIHWIISWEIDLMVVEALLREMDYEEEEVEHLKEVHYEVDKVELELKRA